MSLSPVEAGAVTPTRRPGSPMTKRAKALMGTSCSPARRVVADSGAACFSRSLGGSVK